MQMKPGDLFEDPGFNIVICTKVTEDSMIGRCMNVNQYKDQFLTYATDKDCIKLTPRQAAIAINNWDRYLLTRTQSFLHTTPAQAIELIDNDQEKTESSS